jgi:UDP-glucose 4-epimerase
MNGKSRLLITGGLGNLGSWLTYFFSDKYDVYILSKNNPLKLECKYTLIQADITSYDELALKLSIEFDYCIHTASYNDFYDNGYAKKALIVNSLGTRNLLEVIKNTKIKNFIYLSTFHVYGVECGDVTEKTELNPINDYASTHLFAEYYIKQFHEVYNLNYTILRLTNSYGAPKHANINKWHLIINDLVKGAYDNGRVVVKSNGNIEKDFIYMGDVCNIVYKLLAIKPKNDVFNLSSGRSSKIIDIARMVQHVYKNKFNVNINIEINNNDNNNYNSLLVKNEKLKKVIDFEINDAFLQEIKKIFIFLQKV